MNIEDTVFDRVESVGVENLTNAERVYWLIWVLEAQTNNGGLESFLESSLEYATETIEALKAINAQKMASLLQDALSLYESSSEKIESDEMSGISNSFTDYPDDLSSLIDNFVNLNYELFLGPKTEIELWKSRKSRNVNTPRFVTKEIDYEKEAIEDEAYSSRHCPECSQPVPDYRKTCKRCGYPIGIYVSP